MADAIPDAGARGDDAGRRIRAAVETAWHEDSRRVLATLIRLLGDFDLAEEALADAFAAALGTWPTEGVPTNPRVWLVSAGHLGAWRACRNAANRCRLVLRDRLAIDAELTGDPAP